MSEIQIIFLGIGLALISLLIDRYFSEKNTFAVTYGDIGLILFLSFGGWLMLVFLIVKWIITYWRSLKDCVVFNIKK